MTALLAALLLLQARPAGIFSDGAVLQRDRELPVWGLAEPGTEVTVRFAGQAKSGKADAEGRWRVDLDPVPSGGPHELVVEGGGRTVVKDVLVGEVWLVAGGGVLAAPLKERRVAGTLGEEQAARLRGFRIPAAEAEKPARDLAGSWSSKDVAELSAAAYLFALELMEREKVPVGLVQALAPERSLEQWISAKGLTRTKATRGLGVLNQMRQSNYRAARTLHLLAKGDPAKEAKDPAPQVPSGPSRTHNAMLAPLAPFALKGALLDAGDADLLYAAEYPQYLEALVQDWRDLFGRTDLPVGYVQSGRRGTPRDEPDDSLWGYLREAQAKGPASSRTGMVVSLDLGADEKGTRELARRLGLWARAEVYGEDVAASGPVYDDFRIEGDRIRLRFKSTGGGLVAAGGELKGFAISGEFNRFVAAQARIEGDTVVVWSDQVKWPFAVRYGWADWPDGTLAGRGGLPASPFRTDAWPKR